ncbi:MAG: formylmethanofuran dehydrogenase subunit C [Pirellulales bacterium]
MPLKLTYTGRTSIPVEIEGLTPSAVSSLPLGDIERFEVFHGNEKCSLADFFTVAGDASDARFEMEGDLSGVHWIGAGMTEGEIHISGSAGRHVGSEMRGGQIHVSGDAGDWVGAEMYGGLIHVRGRAGHLIGAAYRGSSRGMRNGTILIGGDVGNEIGHTMRRGMIAVGGSCGDMTGFNMISGNVLVFGAAGIRPGAGMRRGTIGFFGDDPPPLLPSFRRGSTFDPLFLQMTFRQLRGLGFGIRDDLDTCRFELYHGDFIEGGRGEIIVASRPN